VGKSRYRWCWSATRVRIQGSSSQLAELKDVIALERHRQDQADPIEKRPLSEVSRTLDQLKAGQITGRVVAAIDDPAESMPGRADV